MKKAAPSAWDAIPREEQNDILVINEAGLEEEEEADIDENQRLHLQKVSSLVDEAYRRVEHYSRETEFYKSASVAVSERSSCTSTHQHAASLPESLDGGQMEVEELKSLPPTLDSTLKVNQTLQKRFSATLTRLQKTLEENLTRQDQLKEEIEEQTLMFRSEATSRELRERYRIRVSTFNIPYFKDRQGLPAPMNDDTKIKVENGYIDLYSTKCRTWLVSERRLLVKAVQKEYKENAIQKWASKLKDAERILKDSSLTEEEIDAMNSELEMCTKYLDLLSNAPPEKLEFHSDVSIAWDKISAQAFDGSRTPEECQLQWDNYANPSINCGNFTEEEDIMLQTLINKDGNKKHNWPSFAEPLGTSLTPFQTLINKDGNKMHDWQSFAESLGTGRTPFQVMTRWVSFIYPALNPARWNAEDSRNLVDTVNMLRIGNHIPWSQVSRHLLGYTPSQMVNRWRIMNPNMMRGSFTREEDFNLIKGIYMFGINFDMIAHFLPGRSKDQVRDRFKRSLLPGLTHKPWTLKEDRKVIHFCHINFKKWRMLASCVPTRNACELRLRYYTLHFWQDISDKQVMPPPLFPLSQTKKPEEIKFLRAQTYRSNASLRPYLDKVDAEFGPKKINLFEEKRLATSKNQNSRKIAKLLLARADNRPLPTFKDRRGAKKGPRTPTWPDMVLIEYFLPHRKPSYMEMDDPIESCWQPYLTLSQTLLLNVQSKVTPEERKELKPFGLTDIDFRLILLLVQENLRSGFYSSPSKDNKGPCPDTMPLIPPSSTTLGALLSLLIHLPKLKEMVNKKFLLFQITKKQLPKLGIKPRTLNLNQKKKDIPGRIEDEMILKMKPQIAQLLKREQESEMDYNLSDVPKRAAAHKANIVNQVFIKTDELFEIDEEEEDESVLVEPTEGQMEAMQLACKVPSMRYSIYADDETAEAAMERSDQILFHRFMSLFLLPCIFTMKRPPKSSIHISNSILNNYINAPVVEEDDDGIDDVDLPSNISSGTKQIFPSKYGPILPHLDSNEQNQLISELEGRLHGRKRRGRLSEFIPHDVVKAEVQEEENEDESIANLTKADFVCNKKAITSLKRSMIMKRLWEDRRSGLKPYKRKKGTVPCGPAKLGMRKSVRKRNHLIKKEDNESQMDC